MSRTAGMYQQGTPNPDGHIFISANDAGIIGTAPFTRFSTGNIYALVAASQTAYFEYSLNDILFRYGVQDDLQQFWGSTANGGAQGLATPPAIFTTPAPLLQRPPFTGSSQLVPPVSRPTGINIANVIPVYQVLGTAATNVDVTVSATQYANGVALAITPIKALTALPTAVSVQPTVSTVAVNSGMLTPRLNQYSVEFRIVAPAGCTVAMFGVFLDVIYNYN